MNIVILIAKLLFILFYVRYKCLLCHGWGVVLGCYNDGHLKQHDDGSIEIVPFWTYERSIPETCCNCHGKGYVTIERKLPIPEYNIP